MIVAVLTVAVVGSVAYLAANSTTEASPETSTNVDRISVAPVDLALTTIEVPAQDTAPEDDTVLPDNSPEAAVSMRGLNPKNTISEGK
ncbi:MAG: hypothetical protein L3K26_06790, partial [Candidatus Hydrogenedentes bacterium]|nr:hypothetical protein [Candidatus Hydrogenedentota bacterium]